MTDDSRCRTLRRALRLATRLQGATRMPPLVELARECGVCVRTIRRDLYALQAAGWPTPPLNGHCWRGDRP